MVSHSRRRFVNTTYASRTPHFSCTRHTPTFSLRDLRILRTLHAESCMLLLCMPQCHVTSSMLLLTIPAGGGYLIPLDSALNGYITVARKIKFSGPFCVDNSASDSVLETGSTRIATLHVLIPYQSMLIWCWSILGSDLIQSCYGSVTWSWLRQWYSR